MSSRRHGQQKHHDLFAYKTVVEEEELIFYGIEPICPVVKTRALIIFVRNILLKKLLVQVTVYLIEEVSCAAFECDVQARLDKMSQIDDCVIFPVLGILLDCTKTLRNMPALGEWAEVYAS